MKRLKRWIGLIALCMCSITFTGCEVIHPDTEADLATRINLNLDKLKEMQETGFINQSQYNQLEKALKETEENIRKALDGNKTAIKYVGPAITWINKDAKGVSELKKYMGGDSSNDAVGFTEESEKLLSQVAKVDLYVLKPLETGKTLDDVIKQVNRYMDSKKDDFETYLGDYFAPAKTPKMNNGVVEKDANGNPIMENVTMELPPALAKTEAPGNSTQLGSHFEATGWRDYKVCDCTHGGDNPDCDITGDHACYQYDEKGDTLCSNSKTVEKAAKLCTIRLYEVNPDFMEIITSMDDSEDPNYIFHRDSSGGVRMILLNYPVTYIEKIKKVENENDTFESIMKTSDDLFVNLKQGKLKRKLSKEGEPVYTDVAQNGSSLYITDSVSQQSMSNYKSEKTIETQGLSGSSFLMYGESTSEMDTSLIKNKEVKKEVTSGSIVLRDYVETVYMPGVSNENWIATGRKIRFEQFKGSSNLPWATYIDNAGHPYQDSYMPKIFIQDLLENKSGHTNGSEYFNKLRPDNNFELGLSGVNGNNYSDADGDGRIDSSVLDSKLQTYYKDEIELALQMPSEFLDSADMDSGDASNIPSEDSETKVNPIIYCIKTDKSMFETKLKADWLNSTDPMNSVVWWNTWLMNNGFSYQLGINETKSYFEGTYGYEANEDGYINFNLDTIKKLQDDLDTQKRVRTINYIRAVFTSLGVVLMFYGLILLGAWAFDVNISIGMPLLKILTFGKMIAVTEQLDNSGESYNVGGKKVMMMDFKNIVLVALGVSLAGVVCAFFDIMSVVEMIIRLVTTIAVELYELIF